MCVAIPQKINANAHPYADLPPISIALFEAKAKKGTPTASLHPPMRTHRAAGATFDQIAQAIGRDEVWVAAMFYGQVMAP